MGASVRGDAEGVGVSVRGSTQIVGLIDLLNLVHQNGHAGTIKLYLGERTAKLHFYKGQIYLPTGGSRGSYRIGALLVRAGKLNGRDLLKALQIQKSEGHTTRLGDLLVRERMVKREDLDYVIRAQFEEEITDLLFEADAFFEMRRDVLPAGFADAQGNIQALGFDTRSILMEASRRLDEWNHIHRVVRSPRSIYRLAGGPSGWGSEGPESGPILGSDVEAKIVAKWRAADALFEDNPFDGVKSVDEVVGASGVSAFVAMGTIAELCEADLIRPLTPAEVEANVLDYLRRGRPKPAYRLYEWANEFDSLRQTAANLDQVLLRPDHLQGHTFSTRTASERAVQMLSRLLRRGAPFRFLAREGDSLVEIFYTPQNLRLHLQGPRRTHSTVRYLRRRKAVSEGTLELARQRAQASGRNLDRLLVEDGLVAKGQWIRAVKDKAVSGLFSVFGWTEPHIEVQGAVIEAPEQRESAAAGGLVIEIPLNDDLRSSIRRDLLRWKVLLREVTTPAVIYVCCQPTPSGQRRRAHDLFDGRRSVGDLIRLARVAPLELVRFVFDCVRTGRIRRLTDQEHHERLQEAVLDDRPEDALAYCKSALAFGYAPQAYTRRLDELRQQLATRGPRGEGHPALDGDCDQFSLPELLQLLHQGRRSGTLRVRGSGQEKTLYIHKGDLRVLKSEGKTSDQEVWDLLVDEESQLDIDLGKLLDGRRGSIDESEVGQRELDEIKRDILDVFLWEGARFEFTQNLLPTPIRQDSDQATVLTIRMAGLLIEAMQVVSEWDEIRHVVRSAHAVYRFESPQGQLEAIQAGLGATAYLFDGKHSLADVSRISGEPRLKIYRLAKGLVQRRLLVGGLLKSPNAPAPTGRNHLASGRLPRLKNLEQGGTGVFRRQLRQGATGPAPAAARPAASAPEPQTRSEDWDLEGVDDSIWPGREDLR